MPENTDANQKPNLTLVPAAPPPVVDEAGAIAQSEMPFAVVEGEPITELPRDLYIPPHALEVFLEAFEGPLDLLLYLIRRQNINILDIPIVEITRQYVKYIELMNEMQFELAGEYLLMAATLAEIKSRMLLPRSQEVEEEEVDPRADLVRRLLEYERFKQAAEDIDSLERLERDNVVATADPGDMPTVTKLPDITLKELLLVFQQALERSEMFAHHHVQREALSVRERMSQVLVGLESERYKNFSDLFDPSEGRMGVAVTFLAILELLKESLIDVVQAEPYGPIHVRAAQSNANTADSASVQSNQEPTRKS
ncbi:MAG: segregation/condensation protein A [Rhodothermales bacterium]|nr:segregation/condensation protein A [Rhodothermales bacterium]